MPGTRTAPVVRCAAVADVALAPTPLRIHRRPDADVAVGPCCQWPPELVVGASCCLVPRLIVGASCSLVPDELASHDVAAPSFASSLSAIPEPGLAAAPTTTISEFLMAYRHMLEHECLDRSGGDVISAAEHVVARVQANVESVLIHTRKAGSPQFHVDEGGLAAALWASDSDVQSGSDME